MPNTERLILLSNRMARDVGTPAAREYDQKTTSHCAFSYIFKTPELLSVWSAERLTISDTFDFFGLSNDDGMKLFSAYAGGDAPTHGPFALAAAITRIRRCAAQVDSEHQLPLPGEAASSRPADVILAREAAWDSTPGGDRDA